MILTVPCPSPLHLGRCNSNACTLMIKSSRIGHALFDGGVGLDHGALVLFKLLYGSDIDPVSYNNQCGLCQCPGVILGEYAYSL